MKRAISLFISLAILLTITAGQFSFAYAFDSVDKEKCNRISINAENVFSAVRGECEYLVDNERSRVYVSFTVNDSYIESNDDVSIGFSIDDGTQVYDISVDQNGIVDSTAEIDSMFDAVCEFDTFALHNGTYTALLNIHNGCDINYVSICFFTRGKYYIPQLENLSVIVPTTTKATTTKKAKTKAKATTKKKLKRASKSTTKKSATRTKKPTTTKYYDPKHKSYYDQLSSEQEYDEMHPLEKSTTAKMIVKDSHSTKTIVIVAVASVLATAGIMLVLYGAFGKRKEKQESDDTDDMMGF